MSAFYGLVDLGEGLKKYDLTMTDRLANGEKVYEFWRRKGLWRILLKYIIDSGISTIWSLLSNSPSYPYHQVFKELWEILENTRIHCTHVEFPGAGSSTGIRRAEWLVHTLEKDPLTLIGKPQKTGPELSYHYVKYVPCHIAT